MQKLYSKFNCKKKQNIKKNLSKYLIDIDAIFQYILAIMEIELANLFLLNLKK